MDVILVDESHNFRNGNAQRYLNLDRLMSLDGGRGSQGARKKAILLTATPISNDLMDLFHQVNLIARGDRSYFAASGIADLPRYFKDARRAGREGGAVSLFNLLEEIVIRRTRAFIRRAYPDATIGGKRIAFPERKLKTEVYDLEATYQGLYESIVRRIDALNLAPYNLESYKKRGVKVDDFELGREQALVGIFRGRYLKRLESSIEALRISVRRALEFHKTFLSYLMDHKVLKSTDFQKVLRYIEVEEAEDDATPTSRYEDIEDSEQAKLFVSELEVLDADQYDLRRLHDAVEADIDALKEIWSQIRELGPDSDSKLTMLKGLLGGELKGQKVLVFSYFRDTVRYLYRELGSDGGRAAAFRAKVGNPRIKRLDSGVDGKGRTATVQAFAPRANGREDLVGSANEIDVLLSTDVLSEGQNLQDCAHLINYDLHWNPTRMVQRAGRIDRIGTEFDTLYMHNVFPEAGLERLLGLVHCLSDKIAAIDRTGFLDASILGETVHPRTFNTLKRIKEEDGTVLQEEEQWSELASPEEMAQLLRRFLESGGGDQVRDLPDGIHSGLARRGSRGLFFYFQARPRGADRQHFWRYVDLVDGRIVDNRYLIGSMIQCTPDTARVVGDYDVFGAHERVIEDILKSQQEQVALEAVPKLTDPIQQTISVALQACLSAPGVDRASLLRVLAQLGQPVSPSIVRELKKCYAHFRTGSPIELLARVTEVLSQYAPTAAARTDRRLLTREDLRLICFDHIVG